jgi:nitrite reductase/ring-hydroxylating ferredoxin subunit
MSIRKILFISLLGITFLFLNSCGKDENDTAIPYVYVDFLIYPNTLDYIADGQWAYFSGGYKGIIIYRPMNDQFMAYERACPFDPLVEGARVEVESSGIIAVDSVCGSRFLLTDGTPIAGPAGIPLKQYRTSYDGYVLRVFN